MNYLKLKLGLVGLGIAFMSAPSTAEAQNYARKGAVAGAIIGAIAGAQNDRALGGAVIGGVVGGVAGNAIERSRYGYGSGYRSYGYPAASTRYGNPYGYQNSYRTYIAPQPVYRSSRYYGSGYGRPVYGGGPSGYCPTRGW